ncbi:MAG: hypothetical protein O7C01_07055 [Actinobacteria bacterium]|nr:hypothetical protein [Actinomycetota bacterium]
MTRLESGESTLSRRVGIDDAGRRGPARQQPSFGLTALGHNLSMRTEEQSAEADKQLVHPLSTHLNRLLRELNVYSGTVGASDLLVLLVNWGPCP